MENLSYIQSNYNKPDLLYEGLPAIWDGEKYIVFSPSAKRIIRLSEKLLYQASTKTKLQDVGLFRETKEAIQKEKIARLGLILTTACNLRCKYCYVIYDHKPLHMEKEYAIRILKEYAKRQTNAIHLSFFGGEPTLNFDVLKASVEFAENHWKDCNFHITTNGTAEIPLYDYLIAKGFYFTISLDGISQYNEMQRPFSDGSVQGNQPNNVLDHFVKKNVVFQVRTTVTSLNVGHLPAFVQYCADNGVRFLHFELVSTNSENSDLLPETEKYIGCIDQAITLAAKNGIFLINSAYMNLLTPHSYFCSSVGGEKILYTPDMGMTSCYKVQSLKTSCSDFIIGKYNQNNDSFEIDIPQRARMNYLSVDSYGECKNCFAKSACGGGCPHRNLIATGSLYEIDPLMCTIKKRLIHNAVIQIYKDSKKYKDCVLFGHNYFESTVHQMIGGEDGREKSVAC